MDALEFQKDFLEEVKSTAVVAGEGSTAAFVSIMTEYLINSEVIPDFTPSFFMGTGRHNKNLRVDGYCLDEIDYTMNLFIADYTGNENRERIIQSFVKTELGKLSGFICEVYGYPMFKRNIEESTPAADLIEQLEFHKQNIRKFRLFYITDGFTSDRIKDIVADDIEGIPTEYQVWDIERLFRVCCSDLGRQAVEIDFKGYTEMGIPCLEASAANNEDYKSYLCIIPGAVLADVYDTYGSQLLEGNVRSFLSTKVAVNKKIRGTILSEPEKFFAFNNGVSATAMDLVIETTPEGRFITYAKDFQIVNGGQTTASLSNARFKDKADLSNVYVQMKLTEVDSNIERANELIRNISRSSNSQNKVSEADFFSTHPFHVRMEQIANRLYAPATGGAQHETKWFYERARGQYVQSQMHMTKAEKNKFVAQHPKKQVITKTDLAKIKNTWDGNPQMVSKGAQTNFIKFADVINDAWDKNDAEFNEKYYKDIVALTLLFKHTEWLVPRQPWYEQGYRANIVTYSLALFHRLIKQQYKDSELDLSLIWNRQPKPDSDWDFIDDQLELITEYVYDCITDDDRLTANVTQWCKRDACWESVKKKCNIGLTPTIENMLIDKEDTIRSKKEAKQDQGIVSDMEAQAAVIEYGSEFWKSVYGFTITNKLGAPSIIVALKQAMMIPNRLPNPVQCKQLLKHIEEVKLNGFKY